MAKEYRKIYTQLWKDEKFEQLSPSDKLCFIYLLTGQANAAGLYKLSIGMMAEDTGIPPESCRDAVDRISDVFGWTFSHKSRLLFIPTWFRFNPIRNPKHAQHLFDIISTFGGDDPAVVALKSNDELAQVPFGIELMEMLSKENGKASDIQRHRQRQRHIQRQRHKDIKGAPADAVDAQPKQKRKVFQPPTEAEVREYAAERGWTIDADKFVSFYESKGWMVGRTKMKSWEAAVRNSRKWSEVGATDADPEAAKRKADYQRRLNAELSRREAAAIRNEAKQVTTGLTLNGLPFDDAAARNRQALDALNGGADHV